MTLSLTDFSAFHQAVHGRVPFAWQTRLLADIDAHRAWPRVLDLPTGSGKTTCIDVALFALALDAQRPKAERWCARRIVMVVDRRIVVDQAADRGRKLVARLEAGTDPVIVAVADLLRAIACSDTPLAVYTLRGGIAKDDGWARSPTQPLIIASTVDQIGSRLLGIGYGVSMGMRSIHTGLIANDTLVLLDEVHLSQPFAQTLQQLERLRATRKSLAVPGLRHVLLSATPGEVEGRVFSLEAPEQAPDAPLGPRLHASKPARLEEAVDRSALEKACADEAKALLTRHDTIAVVVNRIASARRIAQTLKAVANSDFDVVLLTGRMRPLDRDDLLAAQGARIMTDRDRAAVAHKLVVVATQCVEAGADFDFDGLVSEVASLDALRQRFGRVDRIGEYGKSESVIVSAKDERAKDDPIYQGALAATWKWLNDNASGKKQRSVDFGVAALAALAPPMKDLSAPKPDAPVLMPAYLDKWMATSLVQSELPDERLWLHGPNSGVADVQLVWRADLPASWFDGSGAAGEPETLLRAAIDVVSAVLPSSLEALPVPIALARQWLLRVGGDDVPVGDVEVQPEPSRAERQVRGNARIRQALRWRGDDSTMVEGEGIRPGDTLIVPADFGGIADKCFDPQAVEPVADLAERAALFARGTPILRCNARALAANNVASADADDAASWRLVLRDLATQTDVPWRRGWLEAIGKGRQQVVVGLPDSDGYVVLRGKKIKPAKLREWARNAEIERGSEQSSDGEESTHGGRRVALDRHSLDVERLARDFAGTLGLPEHLSNDIALAAWLHDIGKADPRFQLMLYGGDPIEQAFDSRLLAKSDMAPGDRQAQRRAQKRSRYPAGGRHELMSLAMIEANLGVVGPLAHDLDLVMHLVATHHGYARPLAPVVHDVEPVEVGLNGHKSPTLGSIDFRATSSAHELHRLDSGLPERMEALTRTFGWHELAYLETVLRLADHRASELEQEEDSEPGDEA